jgi:hypothetical protein
MVFFYGYCLFDVMLLKTKATASKNSTHRLKRKIHTSSLDFLISFEPVTAISAVAPPRGAMFSHLHKTMERETASGAVNQRYLGQIYILL